VTPNELLPASKPRPDGTLVKALARAWQWQHMLDNCVYGSISEIGDAGTSRRGGMNQSLTLQQPLPANWAEHGQELSGRYFLCRNCYRLAYQSQREQPPERALRRANNIRMRLGGDPGMLWPFPGKPKGMHWRTFKRLSHQVRRAERWAEGQFAMQLDRLKPRVGRRNRGKGLWT
jgi:hypothetical protein